MPWRVAHGPSGHSVTLSDTSSRSIFKSVSTAATRRQSAKIRYSAGPWHRRSPQLDAPPGRRLLVAVSRPGDHQHPVEAGHQVPRPNMSTVVRSPPEVGP